MNALSVAMRMQWLERQVALRPDGSSQGADARFYGDWLRAEAMEGGPEKESENMSDVNIGLGPKMAFILRGTRAVARGIRRRDDGGSWPRDKKKGATLLTQKLLDSLN